MAISAVIYGVYSFTNFILFKNYLFALALMDTIWGMALYYISTNIDDIIFDLKNLLNINSI